MNVGQSALFPSGVVCARYAGSHRSDAPFGYEYEDVTEGMPMVHCSGFHPLGRGACAYFFRVRLPSAANYQALKITSPPGPWAYDTRKTGPGTTTEVMIGSMFATRSDFGQSRWGCP
jgi:hypothetical protein